MFFYGLKQASIYFWFDTHIHLSLWSLISPNSRKQQTKASLVEGTAAITMP
jgi:hypothetical protein